MQGNVYLGSKLCKNVKTLKSSHKLKAPLLCCTFCGIVDQYLGFRLPRISFYVALFFYFAVLYLNMLKKRRIKLG